MMTGQLEQTTLNSSYRYTLKIITPEKQVKPPNATVDATWNQFLKKLQLAKSEFFRYHSRPQQRVSNRRNRNSPATKSPTLAASEPYLPRMPTPTSAAVIMLTSLAPSPTARVSAADLFLNISTIFFLLSGVQRQHIVCSAGRLFGIALSALRRNTFFSLISLSCLIFNCQRCSSPGLYSGISIGVASLSTSPHERPMLIAVYLLSPVRMKKVMPARRISMMVCLTSSCSQSSMAVAPISQRPDSMLLQQRARAYSRLSPMVPFASTHCFSQRFHSSSVSDFLPSMRVRRPCTLSQSMCLCVAGRSLSFGRMSSFTVESAPLVQSTMCLVCMSRTITDIRLRTELNQSSASFSYFCMVLRDPLPSATSITRPFSPSSSFSWNLAKLMSAISSGELELQMSLPSSYSTQMSWHREMSLSASCTFQLLFIPRKRLSWMRTLPLISGGVMRASSASS